MNKLIFFKKQVWEKTPSYSYVEDENALRDLKAQGAVVKEIDVPKGTVIGKDHANKIIAELQAKGELWK